LSTLILQKATFSRPLLGRQESSRIRGIRASFFSDLRLYFLKGWLAAEAQQIIRKLTMFDESAVSFATESRIHIGLAVKNVDRSMAFYQTLLGQPPTKTRPGYAKFEVAEPAVNLSLNAVTGVTGPNNPAAHFGVQVKSTAAVNALAQRLAAAGLATRVETNVTCCYAVQNKIWVTDPDGNPWEVFVVLDNEGSSHAPTGGCCAAANAAPALTALASSEVGGPASACCEPGCCADALAR